ncbi:hypothetical protein LTR10_017280 [Elasticomyces elasticus]|nr:hypothetical protein LTR10_017280 [Elasticomyces elasticus]KAK5186004.1 hypothetical protein LTR44_002053 [Eurotiomycetes sp. CCFEE 6388]
MSSYLIKGGHVLLFDEQRKSSFPQLDILVEGQRISKIGSNVSTDRGRSVEVIDASGCIVSPGFIDGHRHVFQSQLRSTVGNHTLLEYCAHLLQGRMIFFDEDDIYLSQLSGLAEAIHSGVTTVMDHSHAITTAGRAKQCIKATVESGIRSIYCAAPFSMPESLNPMAMGDTAAQHAKQIDIIKELAKEKPLGGSGNDGRLCLGLGFDTMYYIPQEIARDMLDFAVEHDMPLTVHDVPRYNLPALKHLRDKNLPTHKVTLSHTCDPAPEDIVFVKDKNIGIVSTPESEMAMSHGHPSGLQFFRSDCRAGLGIDSPAISSGDLFTQMRLALQEYRMRQNATYHHCGKLPDVVPARTDEVLYMATLGGARAIHMEDQIGSLEVGKFADITVIRIDSPSMIASVDYSTALVTHCSAADVNSVMVNGEWVKRNGELLKVNWNDLKGKLQMSRARLEKKWEGVDWDWSKDELKDAWYLRDVLE